MKKLIKISILVIILGLCISIKSFASSPFRVMFKEGAEAEMGKTVEVPLILDSISFDNVDQDLNIVKCRIVYDEEVFEIVDFDTDLDLVNEETGTVTKMVDYNEETKAVVYPSGNAKRSITDRTILGTVTFRVKDNIKTAYYDIGVTDVQAGNDDGLAEIDDITTLVHVKGIDVEPTIEEEEEYQVEVPEVEGPAVYGAEFKEIKLRIQMKKDGTEIVITPDEVNGGKVGSIKVNNEEIERTGDKYIVKTEPNTFYNILAFDEYGNNAYSDSFVTTVIKETSEEETKEEDNKEDEKKDEEKKDEEEYELIDDKKEETNTDASNKGNTKNQSNDVKKSPQTGDAIFTAIILLAVATFAWIIVYGIKVVKEQ